MPIDIQLARLMYEFMKDEWNAQRQRSNSLADITAQLMLTIQSTQAYDISDHMDLFAEWRSAQTECQQNECEIAELAITMHYLREIIKSSQI